MEIILFSGIVSCLCLFCLWQFLEYRQASCRLTFVGPEMTWEILTENRSIDTVYRHAQQVSRPSPIQVDLSAEEIQLIEDNPNLHRLIVSFMVAYAGILTLYGLQQIVHSDLRGFSTKGIAFTQLVMYEICFGPSAANLVHQP